MKTNMKWKPGIVIAAATLIGSAVSFAAEQPELDFTGTLDAVNTESKLLVIDDQAVLFDAGLIVHHLAGTNSVGPNTLKPGTPVGFVSSYKNDRLFVSEIWILNQLPSANDAEDD